MKYHETQISASIPVYALSKFEKKVFLNDLEYFYKEDAGKQLSFFFSCWISSINWSIFRHSLTEIPGKQFFRVSVQGPRCLKECYVFDQLEVYWTVANKTFFLMKTFKPVWFLLRLSRIEIKSAVWNVRFVYSKHAIRHTEGQEFIKLLGFKEQ